MLPRPLLILAAILVLASGSCSRRTPAAAEDASVPRRIISLAPNTTEILFALGVGDRIVGVSSADDYPSQVSELPKVGIINSPEFETIVSLRPDLIVATGIQPAAKEELIRKAGLRLVIVPQETLADVYTAIRTLGNAVGHADHATRLIASLRARERAVVARTERIPVAERPKIFVMLGQQPVYTAGPGSFVADLVHAAGGRLVTASLDKPFTTVTGEFVIEADPDVILVGHEHPEDAAEVVAEISSRLGWANVAAVRQGRIIADMDPDILWRPGPRLIDGLEQLAARLHPELFKGAP